MYEPIKKVDSGLLICRALLTPPCGSDTIIRPRLCTLSPPKAVHFVEQLRSPSKTRIALLNVSICLLQTSVRTNYSYLYILQRAEVAIVTTCYSSKALFGVMKTDLEILVE